MRERDSGLDAKMSNEHNDDLDRVLNSALAMYATVEAREGLAQRIVANLRSQESSARSKWWTWGLAAAVLAMIIVAVGWRFNGTTRPSMANRPGIQQTPVQHLLPQRTENTIVRNVAPVRKHVAPRSARRDLNPKLDQFPSPQPMSEQEKLLAMYINQDPNHAALIAEARMEALRQDEAEKVRTVSADDQGIGR